MKSTIVGANGNAANVTSDGKLEVNTNLGTVTVTDVTIKDPTTGTNRMTVNADGSTNTQLTGSNATDAKTPGNGDVNALHSGYNGATWDRWRNNAQGTLLASAARTTSTISPTQTNYNAKGIVVYLNITLASGTGGLSVLIRSIDPISGAAVNHNIAPTAITATGLYAYELYPGISGSETGSLKVQQRTSGALPRTFYVAVIHGDATGYTYSVGYALDL